MQICLSFPLRVEHFNNTFFLGMNMKICLFFFSPHMDAVGVFVSLQSFLLVICDQISLCNDIA